MCYSMLNHHPLKDLCAVSRLSLLWIILCWGVCGEHFFSFLWDKCPRVCVFVFNNLVAIICNQDILWRNPCYSFLNNQISKVGPQGLMILMDQRPPVPLCPTWSLLLAYLSGKGHIHIYLLYMHKISLKFTHVYSMEDTGCQQGRVEQWGDSLWTHFRLFS
jgi:hypothetical protein